MKQQVERALGADLFGFEQLLAAGAEGSAPVEVRRPLAVPRIIGGGPPRLPGLFGSKVHGWLLSGSLFARGYTQFITAPGAAQLHNGPVHGVPEWLAGKRIDRQRQAGSVEILGRLAAMGSRIQPNR